jgi:hypothetical protein
MPQRGIGAPPTSTTHNSKSPKFPKFAPKFPILKRFNAGGDLTKPSSMWYNTDISDNTDRRVER